MIHEPSDYRNPVLPFDESLSSLNQDQVDLLNRTQLQDINRPIRMVYMDLMCLRDYRLGALLQLLNTKEEYQHVYEELIPYNERFDDDTLRYFPKVKVTQAELDAYIADPANMEQLVIGSPTTELYASLIPLCASIKQHNEMTGKVVVKICINFHPFKPSKEIKLFYGKLLQAIHPNFHLGIMIDDLMTVPEGTMIAGGYPLFQLMFINDFIGFMGPDSLSHESFANKLLYMNTSIFSPKRIDPLVEKLDLTDPVSLFKRTEAALGLCCNFKYLSFDIPKK